MCICHDKFGELFFAGVYLSNTQSVNLSLQVWRIVSLQCVFVKYTMCVFVTSSLEICFLQCVFVKYTKCEFVTSSLEISKLLQLDVSSLGLC